MSFDERNGFMNEIIEIDSVIRYYEDTGYFENEEYVLLISDNKFYIRDKYTNEVLSMEYEMPDDNFDYDLEEEQITNLHACVAFAENYGFYWEE